MEVVSISNFSNSLIKELGEYSDEIADKTDEIVDTTAKIALSKIKANSPKRRGKYKKGWRLTVDYKGRGNKRITIRNATDWQLSHLLEYGHVLKRGGRIVGKTKARPHIDKVQQEANERLVFLIEKAANDS